MMRPILFLLSLGLSLLLLPMPAAADPERLLQEGELLLKAGRVKEALTVLHDAERQLPAPSRAAGLLGEGYLLLGMQRLQGGDEAAARDAFSEAKHYLPDDFRPWQGSASAWLHEGHAAAAAGELQEALALAGDRPELLILLGNAHYALGDLDQAEGAWQQAREMGAGEEIATLLDKVRRDRRAEREMSHDLSGRFTVAYAPDVGDKLAAAVLDVLQDAYDDLGSDLGCYPEADIPVLLYLREDFAAATRSPEWAGGLYDGKIRVPLGGVHGMSPALRALLYHEYAHVVVRFLGKGKVPVWMNEGLAEMAGRRHFIPPPAVVPQAGEQLDSARLERSFADLPVELVPLAYQRSHERVARLVELCGWPPLGELLQRLGTGEGWVSAVAGAYAPCGMNWAMLRVEIDQASPR